MAEPPVDNRLPMRVVLVTPTASLAQFDSNIFLDVTLGTKIAGEDISADVLKIEPRYSVSHLNLNSTVTISTAAYLYGVTINTKGGASNALTLFTSPVAPTAIAAVIDTTAQLGTLYYHTLVSNGLAFSLATGSPADISVLYR